MSGIDWGSVANGGGGGGVSWGKHGTAPLIKAPKAAPSGGHSIWHSIENEVEKVPGSNLASNFVRGGLDTAVNLPGGLWDMGTNYTQDIINHPASIAGDAVVPLIGQPIMASIMSHLEGGHGTNVERKIAVPIAKSYDNKYAPIFEHPATGKSWRGVEKDPFGTALDIATLVTAPFDAGTSLGLRATTLGVDAARVVELDRVAEIADEAERASALAKLKDVTPKQKLYVKLRARENPLTRTVQSGEGGTEVPYSVNRAKTPWGRAVQENVTAPLRESKILRDKPIIGANRVAIKQGVADINDAQMAGRSTFAHGQKAFNNLSRDEQSALHIIAEAPRGLNNGEWLATKIRSLEELQAEAKTPGAKADLQRQLDNLGANDPKRFERIHDAITNPSTALQKARDAARADAEQMRANFPDLTDEQIHDRVYGPARIQGGARPVQPGVRTEHVPGQDFHAEERASAQQAADAATKRYEKAQSEFRKAPRPTESFVHPKLKRVQDEISSLKEQINANTGATRTGLEQELRRRESFLKSQTAKFQAKHSGAYEAAEKELHESRQAYKLAHENLAKVPGPERDTIRTIDEPGGLKGGPSIESLANQPADELHGDPFYFPHRGPQMKSSGLSAATTNMPLGQIKPDSGMRLWQGIRQTTGSYVTNPSAWTRAGMSSLRWKLSHDYQQWLKDTVAIPVDRHHGELPKGYSWFQPQSIKADRAVKERAALHDSLDSPGMQHDASLEDFVNQMLPKGMPHDDAPVYAVPTKYADAMRQEFQRTNTVFHYMFEKPMDFWRAAVLKLRPAWLVNNIVGQHLLYWITAHPGSVSAYFRVLKGEKSGYYVNNVLGRLMHIPAFRNKYGNELEDSGVYGVHTGTTQGTLGDPREEQFMSGVRGKIRDENSAVYGAKQGLGKIITAWPRFTTRANQAVADDWPRLARFNSLARKSGAARRVIASQEAMGEPMSYLSKLLGGKEYDAKIAKEMTADEKRQIMEKVDRALGNFNSLTPFERKYMRRVFPFYVWFKVIGAVSKDLLIDSPLRVNIVYNLAKIAQENPDMIPQSELPSWLQGALQVGSTKNGTQTMIPTTGLNPFNTIPQLAQTGKGVVQPGGSGMDALGLMGPAAAAIPLALGVDPFTGGTYKGAGANSSPLMRVLEGTVAGLPEVQLAQSHGYLGGKPASKSYAPDEHHWGPLSLNDTDLGFLGVPLKKVRVKTVKGYAKLGY